MIGNPGGEGGFGDGLPGGGARADGLADGGDGACADGLAGGGDGDRAGGLAGVDDGEEHLDEVGVELSEESEVLDNLAVSLTPATHSQSIALLRSRTTFALIGYDPEANPS